MKFRDLLAVVIAFAAAIGLAWMWLGETKMVGEIVPNTPAYDGMVNYLRGIGLVLLGVSIAYILLGHEEKISTTVDDIEAPDKK